FQAEDGIRAFHVTGVQTCALPIYLDFRLDRLVGHNVEEIGLALLQFEAAGYFGHILATQVGMDRASAELALSHALDDGLRAHLRSEERRVGKECRSRWAAGE